MREDAEEEPAWAQNHRDADVGARVQAQELRAARVDLSHLSRRVIKEVLWIKSVENMVKLELRNHDQSNIQCFLLQVFTSCHVSELLRIVANCTVMLALLLALQRNLVGKEDIDWQALTRDIFRGEAVKHVELVRHRAFLANWEDLEPTETLRCLDNFDKIVPLFARQRTF